MSERWFQIYDPHSFILHFHLQNWKTVSGSKQNSFHLFGLEMSVHVYSTSKTVRSLTLNIWQQVKIHMSCQIYLNKTERKKQAKFRHFGNL